MIVRYESVTGEVEEAEAVGDIGEYLTASYRDEENSERRERYHAAYSLDDAKYEGKDFATYETPETIFLRAERDQRLYAALDTLTDKQRRRLEAFSDDRKYRKAARKEGVHHNQIIKSVEGARKKFFKFF